MKKRKIVALVCVATVLLLAVSAFWYVQTKLDNSGDSCRVNQYSVGHYEVLGYGVPQY